MRYLISFLLTGFIAFTPVMAEQKAPVEFDNLYKARLYGFNLTVINRLTKISDTEYDLLFKADAMIGTVVESSRMEWQPGKGAMRPLHYQYNRSGLGKKRKADLLFNWQDNSVINKVDNSRWQMKIVENVQDKLSYQVQMAQELSAGKKKFTYQIADGGELKEYSFEVMGEEILETPLGKVNTLKVKRSRSNNKRVTYAWVAPDWHYLLVRLQQEEGGKTNTIYITQAKIDGKVIDKF